MTGKATHERRRLACALVLIAACASPAAEDDPVIDAGTTGADAGSPDAGDVCADWKLASQADPTPLWTAGDGACNPGTLAPEASKNALARLNFRRRLAGLGDVALDDSAGTAEAMQACARLARATNLASHDAPPETECFTTAGNNELRRALLASGTGSPSQALELMMQSEDLFALNLYWLFRPGTGRTAFGWFDSAACVRGFEIGGGGASREWVAWPSGDRLPSALSLRTLTFIDLAGLDVASLEFATSDGSGVTLQALREVSVGTDAKIRQARLPGALTAGSYTATAIRRDASRISWTFSVVDCPAN